MTKDMLRVDVFLFRKLITLRALIVRVSKLTTKLLIRHD